MHRLPYGRRHGIPYVLKQFIDVVSQPGHGRTVLDLAKGVGVRGVKSAVADPHPDTVALLESLMAAKGIPLSAAR